MTIHGIKITDDASKLVASDAAEEAGDLATAERLREEANRPTLAALAKGVKIECRWGARLDWGKQSEWQRSANGWSCTLRYKRRRYTFDFWQGAAITEEPTAAGVLDCLLSEATAGEQDFEEFCDEFGYDNDSRTAERTWRARQKVAAGMRRLLGDDLETFLRADRN